MAVRHSGIRYAPTKEIFDHYEKLVESDPKLKEFVKGWSDLPIPPQLTDPDFYAPTISREDWGALPTKSEAIPLKLPVMYVRYTWVGNEDCHSIEECSNFVRNLQKTSMDQGLPDVPYNFLIGGKGIIYEGRGWNYEADREERYNEMEGLHGKLKGQTIDVAYIGDMSIFGPTNDVQMGAANFVRYNVINTKNIHEMFEVIPYRDRPTTAEADSTYFDMSEIQNLQKKIKEKNAKLGHHHKHHHTT